MKGLAITVMSLVQDMEHMYRNFCKKRTCNSWNRKLYRVFSISSKAKHQSWPTSNSNPLVAKGTALFFYVEIILNDIWETAWSTFSFLIIIKDWICCFCSVCMWNSCKTCWSLCWWNKNEMSSIHICIWKALRLIHPKLWCCLLSFVNFNVV